MRVKRKKPVCATKRQRKTTVFANVPGIDLNAGGGGDAGDLQSVAGI